jgi:hypothetical protein
MKYGWGTVLAVLAVDVVTFFAVLWVLKSMVAQWL